MRNDRNLILTAFVIGILIALIAVIFAFLDDTYDTLASVLATIAGVIPVSTTLIVEYYAIQEERQLSKSEKLEKQFFILVQNVSDVKKSLSFHTDIKRGTCYGPLAFEAANDTIAILLQIMRSDNYDYCDAEHEQQLVDEEKSLQAKVEETNGTDCWDSYVSAHEKAKNDVLRYQICSHLCKIYGICHEKWQELHTLAESEQDNAALQMFWNIKYDSFSQVIGASRALEAFICAYPVYRSREIYKNVIRSYFSCEEIKFLSFWSSWRKANKERNLHHLIYLLNKNL